MTIQITDRAQNEINNILKKEKKGSFFRVSIEGGGGSGFKYVFTIESIKNSDDIKINNLIIDKISLKYLEKSILDFQDTLIEKAFKIQNPNAQSSCGCGVSFSL